MFNNVIDHSQADEVTVIINQNALYTWVNIRDNGVGIFEKIAKYYNYSTLDDIKDLEEDEMISRKANLGDGTLIIMALANQTNRTLKEVFDMYADVEDMGQGFAHELFNVFQKKYPNIEITCINTNENIEKMINRVKN